MSDPFDAELPPRLGNYPDVPSVPSYLDRVGYGSLPRQIVDALEQSGIIGYLTANGKGAAEFNTLIELCTREVCFDGLTKRVDGELFLRSLCAAWPRMTIDEVPANSVASTADEYYKGLFASRQDSVSRRSVTSTGMKGFQEESTPADWDLALGSIRGFRKWSIDIASDQGDGSVIGSYSKDFLNHKMLEDGRRVGTCHAGGANHPKDEVPADTGCGCGWWAYWSPEEARKHNGSGGDGATSFSVTVGVEGSGRVVIGQKGFRSQYIRITGIAPDQDVDPVGLEALARFSRKHLLDAPVYLGADALREGVGVDPTYGTLAARYPEIAGHSDEALAIYCWFLQHVKQDEENCMWQLGEKINQARFRPDEYSFIATSNTLPQDEGKYNFIKISAELLGAELSTVTTILAQRGPGLGALLDKLHLDEANRRIFPA